MSSDVLLVALVGLGLVRSGGRQRTDSTHVLGRLRSLNRLELAGESVRAALEALAAVAPAWLATVISDSWAGVYGSRIDDLRLPESQTKRTALAVAYGSDGYRLLGAVSATGAPPWLRELPAVEAPRRIWVQQYYRVIDGDREKVIWREATEQGLPPGRLTLVSPEPGSTGEIVVRGVSDRGRCPSSWDDGTCRGFHLTEFEGHLRGASFSHRRGGVSDIR